MVSGIESCATSAAKSRSSRAACAFERSSCAAATATTGSSAPNGSISRPSGLTWDSQNESTSYDFIGMGMPAVKLTEDGQRLDRYVDPSAGTSTAGEYPGYDKFGRLSYHHWIEDSSGDSITKFLYQYSPASDVVLRHDARATNPFGTLGRPDQMGARSDHYEYDGLHRLVRAERGVYFSTSSGDGSITMGTQHVPGTEEWTLDMLGNWESYAVDATPGGGGFPDQAMSGPEIQGRDNDPNTNEFLSLSGVSDSGRVYDPAGNLVAINTGADSRKILIYDAWNRLVEILFQTKDSADSWTGFDPFDSGRSDVEYSQAVFTYYALNQRASAIYNTVDIANDVPDQANYFLYDAAWRLLERRIDDTPSSSWDDFRTGSGTSLPSGFDETHQYVWGLTYIDELLFFQRDDDQSGEFESTDYQRYALVDRNFSILGYGNTLERRYSAYGIVQPAESVVGDCNYDDANDIFDFPAVASYATSGEDYVSGDLDNDGDNDVFDYGIYAPHFGQSAPTLDPWANESIVGYAGYIFDEPTGLYCVRNRWYSAEDGHWISRDPATYVDGMNLYQYGRSNPIRYTDRNGWKAEEPAEGAEDETEQHPGVRPTDPQCKDSNGNPISLQFDGEHLIGPPACGKCEAASGIPEKTKKSKGTAGWGIIYEEHRRFIYTPEQQRLRDHGPLPEGGYWINTCEQANKTNAARHDYLFITPRLAPARGSWGEYSYPIWPSPCTDVNDSEGNPRDKFFVHGGGEFGSKGCIDLAQDMNNFASFVDGVKSANGGCCYIPINVKYKADEITRIGPEQYAPGR